MRDEGPDVPRFRMTKGVAKRKINSTARLSANVIVSEEVFAWGSKYAVFDVQLFEILRNGDIADDPIMNEHGDWECTMTYRIRGRSQVYAISVILCEGTDRGRLFLRRVGWEHER